VTFDDPPDIATKPRMEQAENRSRLYRLVSDLPADQRRVVVMRFAQEQSLRDIAKHLGRSEGAVKQLQFRALVNLRAQLEVGSTKPPRARRDTKETKGSRKSGGQNG
jgi:RNA polymerase sigma factor (sigma-70 family)